MCLFGKQNMGRKLLYAEVLDARSHGKKLQLARNVIRLLDTATSTADFVPLVDYIETDLPSYSSLRQETSSPIHAKVSNTQL